MSDPTPYEQGRQAFRDGKSGNAKPWPMNTPEGREWSDGWMAEQAEHAERAKQPAPAEAGHNAGKEDMADTQGITGDQLRSYIERIEKLQEEIDNLNADKREVYNEAKANGFDKTVMGQIVQHRKKRAKNPDRVNEQQELFDLYLNAIEGASRAHAYAREGEASE